jgi:hypothetical protein
MRDPSQFMIRDSVPLVRAATKRPGDFPLGPGHHTSHWPATSNVYPPSALPASSPGEPSRSSPPSLPEALPSDNDKNMFCPRPKVMVFGACVKL